MRRLSKVILRATLILHAGFSKSSPQRKMRCNIYSKIKPEGDLTMLTAIETTARIVSC